MRILRIAAAKLRALVRRDVVAGEIHEEMQFHLDMRSEEYGHDGLAVSEAKRAAAKRFGNVVLMQDRGYDVRGGGVMETVLQDVRYGVRLLGRHRGFSLVAVLTLGLGVGASTALFSIIDATLRSLPYPHPEEMVAVEIETNSGGDRHVLSPSPNDVRRWRKLERVFSSIGTGRFGSALRPIVETPEPQRVLVGEASEDFLDVYGVTPRLGRPFGVEDTRTGAPLVVLLSHSYWVNRFAADPQVIGRTIRLDGKPAAIVGVLPGSFYQELALWRPTQDAANRPDFRGSGAPVSGRLRPGLSLELAARELTDLLRQTDALGNEFESARVIVRSMNRATASGEATTLGVLSAAVGLILLIACVNVAGLLLGRGAMRQPELAVRASMGAGRLRLVRQLLTESLVLSAAGTVAGLILGWLSLDALVALIPLRLPSNSPAELNLRVLALAAGLSLLMPVVFGLVPAFRLSRVRLGTAASKAGRRHGPALSRRGGQLLTAVEVGLAVVLLTGAGLMVRSFERLVSVDLGFDPESFLMMEVAPVDSSPAARAAYYPSLLEAIRMLPGVASAGGIDVLPLGDLYVRLGTPIQGRQTTVQHVLPGYFESLGVQPIEGRFPSEEDRKAGRPAVVLTESTAKQLFPQGSAVGQSVEIAKVTHQVTGVVAGMRRSARGPARGGAYLPYDPRRGMSNTLPMTVVVRPAADARVATLATSLRQAARSIGPPVVIERIRSGSDWLGDQVATERNQTLLLGLLGAFALLLTLVGIFSVTAFAVTRRTQEIGVRMAFGARPGRVVWETVRDATWPIAIGLAAGLTGAFFATRVVSSFLFQTTPRDPVTFVAVAVMLAASALLAAWLPARRAARVDPVTALRAE